MEGEGIEGDVIRLEKRRKLESAIVSRAELSDEVDEHHRNGNNLSVAGRKSSRSSEGRLKGKTNDFLGSERNRSRIAQKRRETDSETRTNEQFSMDGPVQETAPEVPRRRSEVQKSTDLAGKPRNSFSKRDSSIAGENLKRDRDTESRSIEKHKKGRDIREYKRGREEVDRERDHEIKRQARESKIFFDDHEGSRKNKGVFRDQSKDYRASGVQGGILEEDRGAKDKEFRDVERKHGDCRRPMREVKQGRYVGNGTKDNVQVQNPSTRRRGSRQFRFRRVSGNLDNSRSRQDGFFKPNVDYSYNPFAHCPRPRPRGPAFGPGESHKRGHPEARDALRLSRKLESDVNFIRDRGRIGETVMRERPFRRMRGLGERRSLLNRNSNDVKFNIGSKESVDHSWRGLRAKDRRDATEAKGDKHEHISNSQTIEGATIRRCSRTASLIQEEEQDVAASIDNCEGKDVKGLADGQWQEVGIQEEGREDDLKQNEHDGRLKTIDALKSCSPREKDVEVDQGHDIPTEDQEPPSESNSTPVEVLKHRDKRKRRSGSEGPSGKRAHKKEKPNKGEVGEVQQSLEEQDKDDFKREKGAKQHDMKRDVEERAGTEDTAQKESVELQQLKPVKGIRETIEKPNESLLRRQSIKVNRVKDGGGKDASSDKNRKHHSSSHSGSPNAQKRRSSPNHKEHGKSTSPRRFEKDWTEWEKFERERNNTLAAFDSRYRRFGGGTSGLGGYSPRRRRSEAAIKTPSPPPRSPERRKPRAWDLPPPGMDSIMVAAISAAHQAAVQHAVVTLATVAPSVTNNVLVPPVAAPVSVPSGLTTVPSMMPSLLQQVNPAVTAVTLTQATRPLRRLYVGNVPATVSDGELLEFMNAAMLSANANHLPGTKPCINCSVNVEKNYAFAEFITPEDATAALAFDGVTLHGTTLKIRRPKDYVQPANGGAETASPVLDMVSSSVADSPRKVFVGGISLSLTADKVKEIVTAFGQLRAYHWEVDHKTQPPQAFAFLEYMDPSATLKACAGLNGMRLGTGFLTVVQATPDANPEILGENTPFYGIAEHAKTLLEAPTRVLELQNLVTQDELPGLSEEEAKELVEDVRLECSRFGNVKSTHMVRPSTQAEPEVENTPDSGLIIVRDDCGSVPESLHDEIVQEATKEELAIEVQNNASKLLSSNPVLKEVTGFSDGIDKQMPGEQAADCQSSDELHHVRKGETCDKSNYPTNEECSMDKKVGNSQPALWEINGELQPNTKTSLIETRVSSDSQEPHAMEHDPCGILGFSSISVKEESTTSRREWEALHAGRVFVEFSREESARQAAYCLHGRIFGGHKVAVCYFPLKLYQKMFNKGLAPCTIEEKQALALAVQGHLTAHIKD